MSVKKKIILFLLAISIALPKDFLEHVIEFPALVAHYIHHYHHDGHVSFIEFLATHEEGSEHLSDKEHEHLPFNHHHSTDCFQPNNFVAQVQFPDFNLPCFNQVKCVHSFYRETWTSSYTANFWQPPRIV